jgi:hypothetical protein
MRRDTRVVGTSVLLWLMLGAACARTAERAVATPAQTGSTSAAKADEALAAHPAASATAPEAVKAKPRPEGRVVLDLAAHPERAEL